MLRYTWHLEELAQPMQEKRGEPFIQPGIGRMWFTLGRTMVLFEEALLLVHSKHGTLYAVVRRKLDVVGAGLCLCP